MGEKLWSWDSKPRNPCICPCHLIPIPVPLRCYRFPEPSTGLMCPRSHSQEPWREMQKRGPSLYFFMVDDSSILAYTELCPLNCPPRGWVFISLTSWSGSRTAIIQNSPSHWLKSDFWGFTLLMFQCKNPHSKPPQRAIHFHPLHSPSRDRQRLRELSRGHASSYS